jgi:hypothetical protein
VKKRAIQPSYDNAYLYKDQNLKMHQVSRAYRIISAVLAFLMLSTSIGYAVDIHYCQGQIKSLSVFGDAKGCDEIMSAAMSCAHRDRTDTDAYTLEMQGCCDNGNFYFSSDVDQVLEGARATLTDHSQVMAIPVACNWSRSGKSEVRLQSAFRYKPPPIYRDIPVLMQTFLF